MSRADPASRRRGRRPGRRALLTAVGAAGALGLSGAAAAGLAVRRIDTYVDPFAQLVADAGCVQRRADVDGVDLSYVEGPDAGPPLVLLHAQHMDWFSYSRVLPALAERFRVFVVDYPGHGTTSVPDGYAMRATTVGATLAAFVEQVVGSPAHVSGNSSGGLLAVRLAAHRPDLVTSVVLEDPPLFASEYPRITTTIADRSFVTSAEAVAEGYDDDFLTYWIRHSRAFFDRRVFPGSADLLLAAVARFRAGHPAGTPVELGVLTNDTVRLLVRGLDLYDPRFGAAFADGSFNDGFDHADALAHVACPALLVHADFKVTDDGVLDGAMTQDDADRAVQLLPRGTYRRVEATHVVHLAAPELFVQVLEGFALDGTVV